MTPHAHRRQFLQLLFIGAILAIIAAATLSCKKEDGLLNEEIGHGDHSIREWVKDHTFADSCDNKKN
jgi:hypothetical protein